MGAETLMTARAERKKKGFSFFVFLYDIFFSFLLVVFLRFSFVSCVFIMGHLFPVLFFYVDLAVIGREGERQIKRTGDRSRESNCTDSN